MTCELIDYSMETSHVEISLVHIPVQYLAMGLIKGS